MTSKEHKDLRQHHSFNAQAIDLVEPNTAFIDIASGEHWVCIPRERTDENVRKFGAYTCELYALRDWLLEHQITTVGMESTGVYWIQLYQILSDAGLQVGVVNPRDLKYVKGRPKTDKLDCQWGQRLMSCGLLRSSFRPEQSICEIRSIWRMRTRCVKDASRCVLRMQKALFEMNVLLPKVVSDITGKTGMAIIESILAGERNPQKLAELKDHRIRRSTAEIAKALEGDYRNDQLFLLRKALEQYRFLISELDDYDMEILRMTSRLPKQKVLEEEQHALNERKGRRAAQKSMAYPRMNAASLAHELCGVDLTAIPGFGVNLPLALLLETGTDMNRWPTSRHFSSWLGLSPNPRRSGGRDLGTHTKKCSSPAAGYFRQAAASCARQKGALGMFFRRIRAQKGGIEAITATAHKLAVVYYTMIKNSREYEEPNSELYEDKIKQQRIKKLQRQAAAIGMELKEKVA